MYGTLISTQTLAATTKTVTFSAIPQTYTDLYLVVSSRDTTAILGGGYQSINVYLENPGAVNGGKRLLGSGSAASSDAPSYITPVSADNSTTANTFSNNSIYICNYTGTGRKPVSIDGVSENNAAAAFAGIQAGLSEGGSAITQVQLQASGTFAAGSTFSLYGLTHF